MPLATVPRGGRAGIQGGQRQSLSLLSVAEAGLPSYDVSAHLVLLSFAVAPMKKRTHEGPPSPVDTPLPLCVCDSVCATASDPCEGCPCKQRAPARCVPQTHSRHRALRGTAGFTVTDRAAHSLVVVGKGQVPLCSTRSNSRVLQVIPSTAALNFLRKASPCNGVCPNSITSLRRI